MTPINPTMMKTVLKRRDASVLQVPDVRSVVQQLRMKYPAGVNTVLIGLATTYSFRAVVARNGIIAVLIGLLLPAVQQINKAGNSDLALLETAIKPGGTLGFVMADGSVHEARSGRKIIDCEGYTYLSQDVL